MSAPSAFQRFSNIIFWITVAIALGGSVALDIVVAPTIFGTVRRLQVQIPDLPISVNAPNYLGGQIFGDILANFAYVENVCIAILAAIFFLETLLWRKHTKSMIIFCILLLITLLMTTVLFAYAADQVRKASMAWLLALRQNSPHATEARQLLDWWHHASTRIEVVRLLSFVAIAILSARRLPSKPDKLT